MTYSANARELCARGGRLFERKATLNSFWQMSADQFYPERADFTQQHEWGEEFGTHLFDSTPVKARRDLGNAFSSMLRPRGQPWFKAAVEDADLMKHQPVAAFCDHVTAIMRAHIYSRKALFERATKEADHDFAAFGNAVLSVETNSTQTGLLYRCHHLRDCAWAEDKDGIVDTMFRKMRMSARQIRQAFPKANLHRNITKALEKTPDQMFDVLHVMMPAEDYEAEGRRPNGMPWASIYLDESNKELLREAYSHEFRYVVPRWQTISGSPYAVSPAVTVSLADARGMQVMARVVMEAGEKQVYPPMKAVGSKIIGDINLYAGGVTIVDADYDERGGAILEPISLGKETSLGVQMLLRGQEAMASSWMLNKLTLPQHGKTAYETAQLVEEYVRANIPLFEPMEQEYNLPILDETFSILMRMKAFGPLEAMPPELSGMDLTFSFSNPLQDAIEKNKVNIFQTTMGVIAAAEQVSPGTAKNIDFDEAARDTMRGAGAPASWLVDAEKLKQERDAQQQAQAQQGATEGILSALGTAGQAADVVQKGAQATQALQQTGLMQ